MVAFCRHHGIAHEVCGKVIVATEEKELPLLDGLYRRGLENGLEVFQIDREQIKEVEPHVRCLRGLRVPATGIVSFRRVCEKFAELIRESGGVVRTEAQVSGIRRYRGAHLLEIPTVPNRSEVFDQLRRLVQRSNRATDWRGCYSSDCSVPRGILRACAREAASGQRSHLSGARSGISLSWRPFHAHDRRLSPRWSERGARFPARGLL